MILKLRFKDKEEFDDFFFGPNAEKDRIYDAIVDQIEESIELNGESALFAEVVIKGDPLMIYLTLPHYNWLDSLQNALKYYEEREDYEKCIDIVSIIKKLNSTSAESN